ncbi:MAG: tRNA pseudouridine(55) synthase TruB [Lachnospiraceae bacterium]|nr:tRNA pseudouridine(55) synthase TruB [Lachnospiraceae bacterium]
MNGIINIYKERGYTSHDVIARLRGITHQRKMGHTGTLDPDAEGVLPVCLGTATRVCDVITEHSKCYEVIMLLGIGTDSQDITGNIVNIADRQKIESLDDAAVRDAVMSFAGEYDQLPPMYSAVRMGGLRLYEIARAGRDIEREPRHVSIEKIEIVSDIVRGKLSDTMPYESLKDASKIKLMKDRTSDSDRRFARFAAADPSEAHPVIRIAFSVNCSKGTYIRSLCSDIGDKLGVFGCVERLMRTRVNIFDIDNAITLSEAEKLMNENCLEERLSGAEELFAGYKRLDVKEKYDDLLLNGNQLHFRHFKQYITEPPSPVRVYLSSGEFLGIYGYVEGRFKYTPIKVFIEKDS